MRVLRLDAAPADPALATALAEFELQFSYPLGPQTRFRISHGEDYSLFYRAIGAQAGGTTFVMAAKSGQILGTLGIALRPVRFPTGECKCLGYLGDLKTLPGPQRGRTLVTLAAEATRWGRAQGGVGAYGIVMAGTDRLPPAYSGKCGIPGFEETAAIGVLKLAAQPGAADPAFDSTAERAEEVFQILSRGAVTALGGAPELRSQSVPVALLAPDGSACGLLEDTRRAKRLFCCSGAELVAAHLSRFAYSEPAAAARLIREALVRCAALAPALFVAIPSVDVAAIAALLGELSGTVATSAIIFSTGLDLGAQKWNVSSSEI